MDEYGIEIYKTIWFFTDKNNENYYVVKDTNNVFSLFCAADTKEITFSNVIIRKNHKKLNGQFLDNDNKNYYVIVRNNLLHSTIKPASYIYGGINSFRINEDVEDYFLYGKIFTKRAWLSWNKKSSSWHKTIAHLLGKK